MAFRGHYEHSLDSKDRLTVPSRFRAALADGVVLSKGLDPCVWVFTPAGFERFRRFLGEHSPLGRRGRMLRRHFHGGSFDEKLDSAGRIRVPKQLIEHAGLGEGPASWSAPTSTSRSGTPSAGPSRRRRSTPRSPDIAEGLAEDERGG